MGTFSTIGKFVTSKSARAVLQVRKASPEILTVAGVISFGATIIVSSRATLHLQQVIQPIKQDYTMAKKMHETPNVAYSDKDFLEDRAVLASRAVKELTVLYGPTILLAATTLTCFLSAHKILSSRNTALMASYAALDQAFKKYRDRVVNEVGTEKEREFRYGVTEQTTKSEDDVEMTVSGLDPSGISIYARFFDEANPNWTKTPEYNKQFVAAQQNYANDLLNAHGHVFLNEVYDMLGMPRSSAGAIVGWVKDSSNGDNYVDFGMYNPLNEAAREFVNGYERSILLDFNVDGVIYNLI